MGEILTQSDFSAIEKRIPILCVCLHEDTVPSVVENLTWVPFFLGILCRDIIYMVQEHEDVQKDIA